MKFQIPIAFSFALASSQVALPAAHAADAGVQCRIDESSFVSDPGLARIDYVIPPGGKPPRFRLLAGHLTEGTGTVSVELKVHGIVAVGTSPLSLEPTWKSVLKLPKQQDSPVMSGEFLFTHFDPKGDAYATGTVQFKTTDGHHGDCRFNVVMQVTDLGSSL